MQKNTKRSAISLILSVVLVLSLFTGIIPAAVAAEQPTRTLTMFHALDMSYLTLAPGSDATQLTFSWHTSTKASDPVVRIWNDGGAKQVFTGTSSSAVSGLTNMYYNAVTVSGLNADTGQAYFSVFRRHWSASFSTQREPRSALNRTSPV